MAKYELTERQKDLLRSIVPGLQDGTIADLWGFAFGLGGKLSILSLNNKPDLIEIWRDATQSDIDTFVENGFFRDKGSQGYTLNAQKIIDAVNSNFGENDELNQPPTNSLAFNPIFGLPATHSQYEADVFVMMPFKLELKSVYDDCIKPAVQSLNLTVNRGDDFFTKHTIMTDIWSAVCHCQLVIADCTGKNANVFYEMGMAHTVGKPVIAIAQNEADIPFDIQQYRYIVYQFTPDGLQTFGSELKDAINKILSL